MDPSSRVVDRRGTRPPDADSRGLLRPPDGRSGHGAPVTKADVGWNIGAIDYEVQAEPDWLALPERYRLLASHQDQVLEVPDGALLLASAERCPVAAYSVDDHVLCVQGHPEFVPDLARSLYRSRVERIGAEPIAEALATLDRPLDNAEVARWLASVVLKRGGP